MNSDKMLVDAQLKKLMAAFPAFKPRPDTLGIYIEHMEKMHPAALKRAVELSIETGGKFPTISDLRKRTGTLGENVVWSEPKPEPKGERYGADWFIDAAARTQFDKNRKSLYRHHFDIGFERTERHLEEQIAVGAEWRAAHPDQARF